MDILWRGNWATRLRIGSGLILFTFALFHFINIALGLVSHEAMDRFQDFRQGFTRNPLGGLILHGSLLVHAALALFSLAARRTLQMSLAQGVQFTLGLAIPLLLLEHITHTRIAHEVYDVNDRMSYIMVLIWGTRDGWLQSLLLLLVWLHGCIGLHYWLRLKPWWGRATPYLIATATLIPALALAGFLTEGRRIQAAFADPEARTVYLELFNWPENATFGALISLADQLWWLFIALLAAATLVHFGRRWFSTRSSVRIRYVDGPEITSRKGLTLLEMSKSAGVAHTALCGGRGRCTTCRVVVEEGGDLLHPPSEGELRSLRAVNAPPNTRLACQVRPTSPATVFRVFLPDGKRGRAHASQGQERRLAILFCDMRGFTARTTGQLPYDVVFLLNRFFDAIVPPIVRAGGSIDKYLGDGLLAVFEAANEAQSAKAALRAAADLSAALARFNETLANEGLPEIRIGVGLHLGELVLGEIGAAGHAPRTIIGDTVNAASRLEGQTKELGVELLVSVSVLEAAELETEELELTTLTLRGVTEPVTALALTDGQTLAALLNPSSPS
ncbi:adenylate/guanylate cyclase domain-containing protein [Seohaeicola saemankumensis]|nr:adenylate/guanylate cyclase domain-containing protein [Seohaeicola saemankumensis]MCA0869377.1 adenylate/guanylate cyclase domain-containing protein [Seohaeicola saemankumensis]